MEGKLRSRLNRLRFLLGCTLTGGGIVAADLLSKSGQAQVAAPAIVTSDKMRPQIPFGVASGDITGNSAVVWSRCNRPGRMIVKYSTTESFRNVQRVVGPAALENSDFTARIYLADLPLGQQIFYRVTF
ncbi:PhoD-like phosphatase N-terminal domain-containing protein [Trichocoleus sp. ST-U3]